MKVLSTVVKQLYVNIYVTVSHGCALGEKYPLVYEIEFGSICSRTGGEES